MNCGQIVALMAAVYSVKPWELRRKTWLQVSNYMAHVELIVKMTKPFAGK